MNTCFIYKYYGKKWLIIYSFIIHENWIPCHDWERNIINNEAKDPVKRIGKGKIEVRLCDGGDLKILKVNLINK